MDSFAVVGLPRKTGRDPARVVLEAAASLHNVRVPVLVTLDQRPLGWVWELPDASGMAFRKYEKWWTAFDDIASFNDAARQWRKNDLILGKADAAFTLGGVFGWGDFWPVNTFGTTMAVAVDGTIAGTYPGAARTARQLDDQAPGALYIGTDQSPRKRFVQRIRGVGGYNDTPYAVLLYDRVLTYEACDIAAAQRTMTNGVAAQRYIADGQQGLQICVTGQTALDATATNLTELTYTDQDGNSGATVPVGAGIPTRVSTTAAGVGQAAPVVSPCSASAGTNYSAFLPLATGDYGARSIASYTFDAANAGTLCIALMYPLIYAAGSASSNLYSAADADFMFHSPIMERVYDGACLNILMQLGATVSISCPGWRTELIWEDG